jgi:thiosulfate dehydrogenase
MNDTKKFAPLYAGDAINCSQCHFSAGNTLGGMNGGISLVGVSNWYPGYSDRDKKEITLVERINNCFERSMSGHPAPENSSQMKALIVYMDWISSPVKEIKDTPWRGLPELETKHIANAKDGAQVYQRFCAECHGPKGKGDEKYRPLWGPTSFNDGAGMNRLETLASFVFYNMPYQTPMLTKEQALDVASFIVSQERPHY